MRMRVILVVVMTLVMAGSLSVGPAAAGDAAVPFKATIQTFPQIMGVVDDCLVVEIPGEGQVMHLGETVFYSGMWACFDGSQYGTMTFTAANGDRLVGGFEGTWSGMPPGPVSFGGTFWITEDSTGRFEGATATGTYWGTAEATEGILYFDGMLTK